jgi:RNA-directed DNA polymerase
VGKPKQETEAQEAKAVLRRMRWSWVEASVWTDSMLAALENGVKGGKWFSLIDKVYGAANLDSAWYAVKRNKGAAGIDRITIERYEQKRCNYLLELGMAIHDDTYNPQAIRRVYIPKGDGKTRPLGIPTVNDRIAQAAVKQVIEPILEKEFLPMSYGFRPNRGAKDALREVDRLLQEGNTWVVDADLKSYFDTIPHENLMTKLERHISDGRLLALVKTFLKQKIIEEGKDWVPIEGTPQGGVLSPVLANLYLHDLDVTITQAGYKMIRYADDFVILTKSQEEAETALTLVRKWVEENKLTLHPDKTHIGNSIVEGEGFDFLGYRFEARKKWIRQKSINKFREAIREKTARGCSGSMEKIIAEVNKTLKGWYQYFKHVTKYNLNTFDAFVRRRLRAILLQRHKRRGFGRGNRAHQEWPNEIFAKRGLFTMETTRVLEVAGRSRCGNYRLESRMH